MPMDVNSNLRAHREFLEKSSRTVDPQLLPDFVSGLPMMGWAQHAPTQMERERHPEPISCGRHGMHNCNEASNDAELVVHDSGLNNFRILGGLAQLIGEGAGTVITACLTSSPECC